MIDNFFKSQIDINSYDEKFALLSNPPHILIEKKPTIEIPQRKFAYFAENSNNVGIEQADNVIITLSSEDEYISFTDDTENYGSIAGGSTSIITDGFAYNVNNDIPDEFDVSFEVSATDGSEIWISHFSIEAHAPIIEFVDFIIEDPANPIASFSEKIPIPSVSRVRIIKKLKKFIYLQPILEICSLE